MVRARVRPAIETSDDIEKRINSFADQADLPHGTMKAEPPAKDAKRDFKSLNLPLNEYESIALDELCKKLTRSKSNVLRYALIELAKREGIEKI